VYFRQPPQPIGLGVAVTQYENRSYPPNAFARQDGTAIRGHLPGDSAQAEQAQQKQDLLNQVAAAAERSTQAADKGRPVVVHLSAHAVNRGGKVYLLPGLADPDNPASWLALDDVLAAFARGNSPRLLLLDLAHPIADAHAGLLADDVAAAIHEELSAAEKDGKLPFLVLTACKAGEVANASVDLQRSIFGFFIEQALLGHADGWGADEKDGKVSARELMEYVRVQVAEWAALQRLSPQTPQLYGHGKDFVLIAPDQPFRPVAMPDPPPDYPKWLEEAWAERDKWQTAKVFRTMPRTFRELEVLLAVAEQRWLAGGEEEKIKSEFDGKFSDLKKQRGELALKTFGPRSVAEARRAGIENESKIGAWERSWHAKILASKSALKPDELKVPADKLPDAAPFHATALHALAAAGELDDPTLDQLKGFEEFLRNFTPAPRFIELAALRFLVDLDPRMQERWKDLPGVRHEVLAAARSSEDAAAIDPRALPWVKADLATADKNHREALFALATGGEVARRQGREQLQLAISGFEQVASTAHVLEAGFQRLEEARVLLPALVVPLGRRVPDPNDEKLWTAVVTNTGKLQQLLTPPATPAKPPIDEITALARQLENDLNRLREPYQPAEAENLIRLAGKEKGPTADDLRRLLDSPLWPAPSRKKIYDAARELGKTAAGESISHTAGLKPHSPLPPDRGHRPDAPAWRAKLAIDLLGLDGITDTKTLDELQAKAEASGNWQELAEAIRRAWAVTLPAKFRDLTDAAARERAGAVLHPLDVSAVPGSPGGSPVEPAAELRRRQYAEFWQWLARERYQKASEELSKVPNRADLADYAKAFDEMRREFLGRAP
jgi:hypothetical protein